MAKDKTEKTNVMRLLEQKKLPYTPHDYLASGAVSGVEVAAALGEPPERVFKTLVTTGASGGHYVFVIPVAEELDLKKSRQSGGGKEHRHAAAKGAAAPHRVYPRRVQPHRHEKNIPHRAA